MKINKPSKYFKFFVAGLFISATCWADAQQIKPITTNGYFRLGASSRNNAARNACFQLAGAHTKYRLGNECDGYADILLTGTPWFDQAGRELRLRVGVATYGNDFSAGNIGLNTMPWFNNLYMELQKLPELKGGSLWFGRRFYKRRNVMINDFFYNNPTGDGLGIEDVDLLNGKFSYAYFRGNGDGDQEKAARHSLQWSELALAGQQLAIGMQIITGEAYKQTPAAPQSGLQGFIELLSPLADSWNNTLHFQYGNGPALGKGSADSLTTPAQQQRWLLLDYINFQLDSWSGQLLGLWQQDLGASSRSDWQSIGGRVAFALSANTKLLAEMGHDTVREEQAAPRTLTKFTLAAALAPEKGFFSRPELRVYYTYAIWNAAAQRNAEAGSALAADGIYGDSKHGYNIGIQVESWW